MRRLRFRGEHLPAVLSGAKTCTIRFKPPKLQVGDLVRLEFGRRDRPTVLVARVEAVEEYDLEASVAIMRQVMEAPSDEEAERLYEEIMASLEEYVGDEVSEEVAAEAARLHAAIAASGMGEEGYWDLLAEMALTGAERAYAIWFRLEQGA